MGMRKMIENFLVFIILLFSIILLTLGAGYFAKRIQPGGNKTLDEKIYELDREAEQAELLVKLTMKEKEISDNLNGYYVIYGSAMQKLFCGKIKQKFFTQEVFLKDCEAEFKKAKNELLIVKSRNFLVRIFTATSSNSSFQTISFDLFFELVKSDLGILEAMHKNASNNFLLKIMQDKNAANSQNIKQISFSLKKAEEIIDEIKKELDKFEAQKASV